MITIRLDGPSVGKIRLATSPLNEVAAWLHLGATRADHALFGDPGSSARFALRDPDVVLAARILISNADGYRPDLLYPKPPPGDPADALDRQLQLLRETPPDAVTTQLLTHFGSFARMPPDIRHAVQAGRFAGRLANGLQRFWRIALADQYDALDGLIATDLANRARTMAQAGVGQMLNTLHPRVGWRDSRLELGFRYEASLDLADVDLVIAPSVLAFPHLQCVTDEPDNAVVIYPVAGLGTTPRSRTSTLVDLLGASRAQILHDLDQPRSTTELSQRHKLSASTVSYHLGVLLSAGMVHRTRRGLTVEYARSARGDTLVNAG